VNDSERVLELLRKAVAILEDEIQEQPTPIRAEVNEDEVTLEGTIGRPTLRSVGNDGIPLFSAGLKVRKPEGGEHWVNIVAWRKVALWGSENLDSGSVVQAVGRWEKSMHQGKERVTFSVRMFNAA
jgi:single-stranded DNA-binding protein